MVAKNRHIRMLIEAFFICCMLYQDEIEGLDARKHQIFEWRMTERKSADFGGHSLTVKASFSDWGLEVSQLTVLLR